MYEGDLLADAEEARVLLHKIAAGVTPEISGALAADALPDLLAAVRFGELATCRLIERVDRTGEYATDGAANTAAYVRNVSGEDTGWASMRVRVGRALADGLPATATAWESGELGLAHAAVIEKATARLAEADAAAMDRVLAEAAPKITPTDLTVLADKIKAAAAPDEAEKAAAKRRDNQKLNISKTFDGMFRIDGWLDTEAGAEVAAALAAFTRKRDPNLPFGADPIGKRRAEALRELARHAITHTEQCSPGTVATSRHNLIIAISLDALQSGLGAADIQGHGTITAGAARRLACDNGIIAAVLGADSEILDLAKPDRLATPLMRRHIALRDGGCLFPGCDRPPAGCEAHHRVHHLDGGPTKAQNLDLVCVFHHHLVHEGGWTYTIIDTDTLEFQPPDGRPPIRSKRRNLLNQDLNTQLNPRPTVHINQPRRT